MPQAADSTTEPAATAGPSLELELLSEGRSLWLALLALSAEIEREARQVAAQTGHLFESDAAGRCRWDRLPLAEQLRALDLGS